MNRYFYWVLCAFCGAFTAIVYFEWVHPNPNPPVKIDKYVDYRKFSLDDQVTWALCYIDEKSEDIKETGQNFSCPDPNFSRQFFDVVVKEMRESNKQELKSCFIRPDLVNIIVVIGEAFYVNVTKPNVLGITQENALPGAIEQICTKIYNADTKDKWI